MANKTATTLLRIIGRFLAYYKGHGYDVKIIRTDRETALLACESDLLASGVTMQRTGTASHAKQAERSIQTVKSRCRATKSSLGFNLPQSLHQYLVMDVVGAMNDCVNSNCTPSTPIMSSLARDHPSAITMAFPSELSASQRLRPIASETISPEPHWRCVSGVIVPHRKP